MADYFTEELKELDEKIDKEDLGYIMSPGSKHSMPQQESVSSMGANEPVTKAKSTKRRPIAELLNMSKTIIGNINSGTILKPKKTNRLIESLHPPVF